MRISLFRQLLPRARRETMARNNHGSTITFFIIGASDLAFVLLFFFMIVGSEADPHESIELPFKTVDSLPVVDPDTVPFKVYIARIDTLDKPNVVTLQRGGFSMEWSYADSTLLTEWHHRQVARNIAAFVDSADITADSIRVAVYSHPNSYYGLVASVLAACRAIGYDAYIVFRTGRRSANQ
jgi:hypothetical protein